MTQTMSAIVVEQHGSPEHMTHTRCPLPTPGPADVLLRLHMTSINFADIKARRAPYRHFQAPYVPGFDGVGTIVSIGQDAQALQPELQVGQRVAAYVKGGSYAEYALADPRVCYPLPDAVSDRDACGIGTAITAYNALHWAARATQDDVIVIHAASGGVGTMALQFARQLGAQTIIASTSQPTKEPLLRELGATHVCLTTEDITAQLKAITQDKGVDVVLDTIGGPILEQSLAALAPFGKLVTFGHSTGTDGTILSRPLHRNNLSIIGYSSGGFRKHHPARLRPTAQTVIARWADGTLRTHIGQVFPLAQAAAAHQLFEDRKNAGKVLLDINTIS